MKDYGYTVRYQKQGSNKWKVYLVTNTYDGALWSVRWYERDPPKDRVSGKPIENVIWNILVFLTHKQKTLMIRHFWAQLRYTQAIISHYMVNNRLRLATFA